MTIQVTGRGHRLVAALLVFVGTLPGADAWACSCMPHPNDLTEAVQQAFDRADIVFTGTAEKVELDRVDQNTFGQIQTTTFNVLESWKGERSARIITKINVQCCVCGYIFNEGETYIVFGYELDSGYYVSSTCDLTYVAERSKDVISKLREISLKPEPAANALQTAKTNPSCTAHSQLQAGLWTSLRRPGATSTKGWS